jgi:cbb3-type cytochrome oxidase subunit 3
MELLQPKQEIRARNHHEVLAGSIRNVQRYNQKSFQITITVSQFFYFLSLTFLFIIIILIIVLTYTTQKKQGENKIKLLNFKEVSLSVLNI